MEVIAFLLALGALLALLITALVLGARLSDLQAQVRRQGSLLDELRRMPVWFDLLRPGAGVGQVDVRTGRVAGSRQISCSRSARSMN